MFEVLFDRKSKDVNLNQDPAMKFICHLTHHRDECDVCSFFCMVLYIYIYTLQFYADCNGGLESTI